MTTINDAASGLAASRRAVRDSERSSRQADTLIAEAQASVKQVREARESNHFADKFRAIIRGTI